MAAQFLHFVVSVVGAVVRNDGTFPLSTCKKCLEPLAVCHIN
uniref:Uncharacterized protein n=1 Tax=Anguilla anguilla TaxID=7936 RepID=A0A0E9QCS1_ANGAN